MNRTLRYFIGLLGWLGAAATVPAQPVGIWDRLHSTDPRVFAASLRAAGFPEATVGLLVSQEVNSRFKEREAALQPSLKTLASLKEGWSSERREALVKLKHERNQLLREILGAVPDETATVETLPETLSHLSPNTRERAKLIVEDYDAMVARIYAESRGALLEEDKAKLRYLELERNSDFVRLLGPDDALDYQIYSTGFLRRIQARLELARPTAAEVREMFLINRRLGRNVDAQGVMPSARLQELAYAALAELAKVVSAERLAELRLAASRRYQLIYELVRRLNLPPETARQIFAAQQAMCDQAFRYSTNRANREAGVKPTPGELSLRLIDEHIAFVRQHLGEGGLAEYSAAFQTMISAMRRGDAYGPDRLNVVF